MKLIKCMICSVNYFLFFHIFTYLGVSCIVNIQEYFHGTFLDITIFLFHYIHRRLLNMTLTRQPHPIWPIRGKSKSDARKSNLVDFTVLRCYAVSLTHTPSAGGHLWSQQWEDQRCWPQHSRTDVCTAHYTCSSSLLHPSSLHTHTHNNQCSSHACRLFGISNYSVEKCQLLPILMMCTTIYTSFLRSPLPRSWIKHQWQSISTDYSAWLLLHRFHLNTHHKKCALSFSLLRKLGQTVFIEFNKEPFTAKQTENKRNAFSLYNEFILLFKKHSSLQQLHL